MKYCVKCGFKNRDEAKFCKNCGEKFIGISNKKGENDSKKIIVDSGTSQTAKKIKDVVTEERDVQAKLKNIKDIELEESASEENSSKSESITSRVDKRRKLNYKFIEITGFIAAILALFIIPIFFGLISFFCGITVMKNGKRLGIIISIFATLCCIVGITLGVLAVNK